MTTVSGQPTHDRRPAVGGVSVLRGVPALRRHPTIVGACTFSLTAWAVVMTYFMLRTPAGDYAVYRGLSPAVLNGGALYDMRLGNLGFTYPAFAALPLSLLSKVGFGLGLFLLTLASMAALARTVVVLAHAVVRERADRLPIAPVVLALVFLAVAVWFAPVTKTLLNGQLNLILVWMVVEDLLGDVPKRWRGVLTGLATGVKLTPALFVVTMLITGRRTWATRAFATFGATVAIGFLVEPTGSLGYWRHLGAAGGYGSPSGFGNQSVMFALVRLVGDVPYLHFLPIAGLVATFALVVARRLSSQGRDLATWGVTAIAMLAVTPVSWTHHWVWMLLPLAALVAALPAGLSGRALLAASIVVLWSGIVSIAPRLDWHGAGSTFGVEVLGNADLLVGIALLAFFARQAFTRAPAADAVIDVRVER